jgi:hypothetical protein
VIVKFRQETAAAEDWRRVASPIAELLLTADHVRTDSTPDHVLITLATISNHASNAGRLNQQVLTTGYSTAIDDGIAALASRILAIVPDLAGYVHADFVRFMAASCDNLQRACAQRRASCGVPQERQRMERAA